MASISMNIIARNEEVVIGPCLDSVQWAEGVIVCDDGSVDHASRTYAILGGYLERQNTYTSCTAKGLYELGRHFAWLNIPWLFVIKPFGITLRKYLLWGIRFGLAGFMLSALRGYDYSLSDAKLLELQGDLRKDRGDAP